MSIFQRKLFQLIRLPKNQSKEKEIGLKQLITFRLIKAECIDNDLSSFKLSDESKLHD